MLFSWNDGKLVPVADIVGDDKDELVDNPRDSKHFRVAKI